MIRDYGPQYEDFRKKVLKRDGFRCKFPGCLYGGKKLVVHHIKRWADYPLLRYEVSNGICLCKAHHREVWGKELIYEGLFLSIVTSKKT